MTGPSMENNIDRRHLLKGGATALAGLTIPSSLFWGAAASAQPRSTLQRPGIGVIGLRYQGSVIAEKAIRHGDLIAVCDVDTDVRDQARASFGSRAKVFTDYRDMLALPEIDVVLIGANPIEIEGQANYPIVENGYNVAIGFQVTYRFPDDVVMTVSDHGRTGI